MNRSLQIRGGLVLVILLVSIYLLLPTIQKVMISPEERLAAQNDPERLAEIAAIDAKAIRQGLDLQGGMYLVLEVEQEGMSTDQARDALERVREILTNRIDQFGVSEPVIQVQGTSRIVVQLPGLQDPERAKTLLGRTARLEFRLVRLPDEYNEVLEKLDAAFAVAAGVTGDTADEGAPDDESAAQTDAENADDPAGEAESEVAADDSTDTESLFGDLPPLPDAESEELAAVDEYAREHPFTAHVLYDAQLARMFGTPLMVLESDVVRVRDMLAADEAKVIPRDMEFQFDAEPIQYQEGVFVRPLYLLNKEADLTGDQLTEARSAPDPDRPGGWMVEMSLNRRGARVFAKLTGENVDRHLAISLDGRVASAPSIIGRIPNGQASITGSFNNAEASDLALLLRAGALPADVRIAEERTVGPSLGRDSISQSFKAFLYGSVLVVIFMLIYYQATGLVTVLALISNVVILMAVLAQFGLVLTLPGIAGIILTVGMAVDANVLINERVREELRKDKTVRAAVQAGYKNATRTIVDANVTTLIVGAILLWFGTGAIKGFAVTLSIGILSSMFTALVMTRVVMEFVTLKQGHRKISI